MALGRLLEQGVKVRWALEPFADAERSFAAGTLLVPASARRLVAPLASELGFTARAVRAEPRALRLRRPRVGLYRSWVPSMDEGWTRFVFEKEMGVAVPGAPRPRGAGGDACASASTPSSFPTRRPPRC